MSAAGCGGLAWNVTAGLPNVFGARYVLSIWFPSPNGKGADGPQRFVLGTTSDSYSSNTTTANPNGQCIQALTEVQAIVAIEPRRFFANISATNDYSYLDMHVLPGEKGGNSSEASKLVRRRREPNPRMPAFVAGQLAWGSPPMGGIMVRGSCCFGQSHAATDQQDEKYFFAGHLATTALQSP